MWDKLRRNKEAVNFTRQLFNSGKLVAAICHGAQTLIETDLLAERKLTSYYAIKTDLMNAGADWVDEEVVRDNNLITSRRPADIPAFNKAIIDYLSG